MNGTSLALGIGPRPASEPGRRRSRSMTRAGAELGLTTHVPSTTAFYRRRFGASYDAVHFQDLTPITCLRETSAP